MANGMVNQHKTMAMGKKVTGMKSGGRVGKAMGGPMGNPNGMPSQAQGTPNLGAGRGPAPTMGASTMAGRPAMPAPALPSQANPAAVGALAVRPGMKSGGALKTGVPTSPLTDSKRANGVPGYKKGGKC